MQQPLREHDNPSDDPAYAVREEDLIALDLISQMLTRSTFDLDAVLYEIVKATAETMRVKGSTVRLRHPETEVLEIRAAFGLSQHYLEAAPTFDTESRFNRLIEEGGVFQIEDISRERDPRFTRAAAQEGIASLLAVGLNQDDEVVGAIAVYRDTHHAFSPAEVRVLKVVANQAAVAIQLAQLHQAELEKQRLEERIGLASQIQAEVLPKTMPALPGMEIAARARSWEEVGGDFFDFITLPEGNLGVALGDVSGKGIPAALLMFTLRTALRAHAEHEYALTEILARVNRALYRDTLNEQFATLSSVAIYVGLAFLT